MGEETIGTGPLSEAEISWYFYPPRWLERRRRREPASFGRWHYVDDPRAALIVRAARLARQVWLAVLAVTAVPPEEDTSPVALPEDEPVPVEPLDRLTPISPNAGPVAPAREVLAA